MGAHARSTTRVRLTASAMLATAVAFTAGCANGPQGAFTGAGLGAGGGALIGSVFGEAGEGAAIGAVSGALAGAVIGDQNARRDNRHAGARYDRYEQQPRRYEPKRKKHDHYQSPRDHRSYGYDDCDRRRY